MRASCQLFVEARAAIVTRTMSSKNCGPHTELASNDSVRVTKCSCGTVHVTLHGSGVTVRMKEEALRGVTAGLAGALSRIDGTEEQAAHLGTTSIN